MLEDDFDAASDGTDEVQQVFCDAAGGSFTLSIFGLTTGTIAFDDDAETVQARLQELSRINSVNVSFPTSQTQACNDCGNRTCNGATGFLVTFEDVEVGEFNICSLRERVPPTT